DVAASTRAGVPAVGTPRRMADGLVLRVTATPAGGAWRLDAAATLSRASGARASVLLPRAAGLAARVRGGVWWSADPTAPAFDLATQVAALRALSGRAPARSLAGSTLGGLGSRRAATALAHGSLLQSLAMLASVDRAGAWLAAPAVPARLAAALRPRV